MKTDELAVPNYTGSFLTGAFLGVDAPGTVTGITFGQSQLIVKKWQLAFVVGNDLLADASVNVADWLLALGGEALANMIDYQGFVGGANYRRPIPWYPQPATSTTIQPNGQAVNKVYLGGFDLRLDDVREVRGHGRQLAVDRRPRRVDPRRRCVLHEPYRLGATSHAERHSGQLHPAVRGWAKPKARRMEDIAGGGPIKPAGEILGYPVYTNRWMPAVGASSATASPMERATRSSSSATCEHCFRRQGRDAQSTSSLPASSAARRSRWQTSAALSTGAASRLLSTLPRALVVGKTSAS